MGMSEVLEMLIPPALPVSFISINIQEITMVYKMIYVSGYPFRCSIIMKVKNWKPPKCQQQKID